MSAALRAVAVLVMLTVTAIPLAVPGKAQGFFQSLFGFGNSAPSPVRPALPPSYRAPIIPPARGAPSEERDHELPISLSGNYRTMCVRTCDGYYFPISASVSRRAFHRDAGICRASCGQEAVLFFHPSSSGDAATMVDLTGRAYAKLPNAFRYRKTLVDGCKCKPDPWARSEVNRHLAYAASEATRATRIAPLPPAAVSETDAEPTAPSDTASPDPGKVVQAQVADGDRLGPARQPPLPARAEKRSRITASARPVTLTTSAKPAPRIDPRQARQTPAKSPMYSLGGPKLRWPGD